MSHQINVLVQSQLLYPTTAQPASSSDQFCCYNKFSYSASQ